MESISHFIGWFLINLDMSFLLMIAAGGLLYYFKSCKWAKRLALSGLFGIFFLATVPVGLWMFTFLENRFPKPEVIPEDAVGVILLGGPFELQMMEKRHETVFNLTAGRIFEFIEFTKKYPHLKRVFSGGGRKLPIIDGKLQGEADLIKVLFDRMGYDTQEMIFEGTSRDTIENAWKTKDIIQPKADEKWVLMTSAYHMPRSVGLFKKAGWNVIPYPVDYHALATYEPWFFWGLRDGLMTFYYAAKEFLAMFHNYIFGRSDTLLPGAEE